MTRAEMILWLGFMASVVAFQLLWSRWLGFVVRRFYSPPAGRVRLSLTWVIAVIGMAMAFPRLTEHNTLALVIFILPVPLAIIATLIYRDQAWPDWVAKIPTRIGPLGRVLALLGGVVSGGLAFLAVRDWPRALEIAGLAGSCIAIAVTGRVPERFREMLVSRPPSEERQEKKNDLNPPSGSL